MNDARFGFGSLLPHTDTGALVITAGPWLRGLWLFLESIGLGILIVLLAMRAKLLWVPPTTVPSTSGETP